MTRSNEVTRHATFDFKRPAASDNPAAHRAARRLLSNYADTGDFSLLAG